jgi:hypothetical protein
VVPADTVDGVGATGSPVPPVGDVYHKRFEPVAVSGEAVAPWQYVTGVITVGADGELTVTVVAVPTVPLLLQPMFELLLKPPIENGLPLAVEAVTDTVKTILSLLTVASPVVTAFKHILVPEIDIDQFLLFVTLCIVADDKEKVAGKFIR